MKYIYHDPDSLYGWYEAGVDFLIERYNHICRNEQCNLGELPRVLSKLQKMAQKTWDERYDLQLRNVVHNLSNSLIEASDEEIQEDARQAGVNLASHAAEILKKITRPHEE